MNGYRDFLSDHADIPIECCMNKTVQICNPDDMILEGCLHAFLYRVYLDRYTLGTIAILAGTLMLMMLVGSVFVCFEEDDELDVEECCEPEENHYYAEEVHYAPEPGVEHHHLDKHDVFRDPNLT